MIIALPQLRQGDVSLSKNQSKPPLCKGRWTGYNLKCNRK